MLVKGPFDLVRGGDTVAGVETIDVNYDVNSDDFETIQGNRYQVAKGHLVTVTIVMLDNDVASLAILLPQYYIPNGGTLSTGEMVNDPDGAIEIVPGGCIDEETSDLIINSCGDPGHTIRILECETQIESIDIDTVCKIGITFRGRSNLATIQLFRQGAVSIVS